MGKINRDVLIENCKKYLGRPYVWGGESMEEGGYDCSGLLYRVLQDSGFQVGRTTSQGYRAIGRKIPLAERKKGDLLFFGTPERAVHVSICDENGKMYESIGRSINTKENPGLGITYSNISRRNDMIEVRTLFDQNGEAVTDKEPEKVSNYQVGKVYTLQAEMKVRTGAGTNYRAKSYSELTANGQKHDSDRDGAVDAGTRVTCTGVKTVGKDIWIQTPSGWIAAVYQGKTYIK